MKKSIQLILVLVLGPAAICPATQDSWTQKADMPTPRGMISTSVVDGVIYTIGGGTGPYSDFSTVEAYDPKTDTWTTKINMPTPRAGLSTCAVDGIIYAIGGHWSPGLATVEAYNPVTDNWTSKTPMPTSRGFLSVSVVDGIIYAIGGCEDVTGIGLSNVEAYDPKTDTWTEKAPMPTARLLLTTCEVDGIIYAIGGASTFTPGASTLKTVEAYDPTANSWTEKADMPTLRGGHSISVVDRIIYAIGGVKYGGGPGLSTVEAYDPVTNIWTTKTDMPTARKFLSSSAVDGKIYVIGGAQGQQVLATVEEYDTGFGVPSPDFNGDGFVDINDLVIMIENWETIEPFCDIAPQPWGDGIVDRADLEVLMEYYNQVVDAAAYYKLDEAEGLIAYDSSGYYHDANVIGDPNWKSDDGIVDGALEFDGIGDYVSTPFVLDPSSGQFSVFAWIKGGSPGQVILSQADGVNWLLADSLDGCLMTELRAIGDRSEQILVSSALITDGGWHRIGFVWDGTNRILYVDDFEVASDTQSHLAGSEGDLLIGTGNNMEISTYWKGLIDDVRIYDRVITP